MTYRSREQRNCQHCGEMFWFRTCYAKRPGNPGKYCSNMCRLANLEGTNNPNAGPNAAYGSKVSQHRRHLNYYQRIRQKALDKIANIYNKPVSCFECGCSVLLVLQVNHINGGGNKRKECGTRLWRKVLNSTEEFIKNEFDILCQVCNWIQFVERKYALKYKISFQGEGAR